jgi:predicted RNA binding protein YcfA (HicA-like mRNA interferase family)
LGKLRVLSGKEACEILGKHGFVKARQTGSHIRDAEKAPDNDDHGAGA